VKASAEASGVIQGVGMGGRGLWEGRVVKEGKGKKGGHEKGGQTSFLCPFFFLISFFIFPFLLPFLLPHFMGASPHYKARQGLWLRIHL